MTGNNFFARLFQGAQAVLKTNDLGRSTKPAPRLYPHQWNWDSAFIAIGLSHYDNQRARTEIHSLLNGQWKNGMIPHIIFNPAAANYQPGPEYWECHNSPDAPPEVFTSGITQPPILALAALDVYNNATDKQQAGEFLKTIYPRLYSLYRYFIRYRRAGTDGLTYIIHPWESGLDNSPRWDKPLNSFDLQWQPEYKRADNSIVDNAERPSDAEYERYSYLVELYRKLNWNEKAIRRESPFLVQPVLFNCLLSLGLGALEKIAGLVGTNNNEITRWKFELDLAINNRLWDIKKQAYGDFDLVTGNLYYTDTVAQFAPLMAGIAPADRVEQMVRKLHSADYWPTDGYPLCSVSRSDPAFDPIKYWRGPVWININWLVIRGLESYGFQSVARKLADKTLDLVNKNGFYEYFNPHTGRGHGSDNFSWTAALVVDLVTKCDQIDRNI